MHPPGSATVVVRFSGELGVKSHSVQGRMERRVRENVREMLAARGLDGDLEHEHTRLYVSTPPERIEAVLDVVTDAFGVTSASAACRVEPTMDAICARLRETTRERYDGGGFAVRARRAGPASAHPFSSEDIETVGGSAVWEAAQSSGFEPTVELDDPDHTFRVECREDRAFVYLTRAEGPGGLPVGSQQPLVALVSGGIDSPVAAWQVMKRGCPVYPLYLDLGDYGGVDHRLRAEETVRRLGRYLPTDGLDLRVTPAGEALDRIVAETESTRMLVARRFMFRVAELVAEDLGAVGIVTGEAIGQKSSQTSASLRTTSNVTSLPVHRPLLSMDKESICARAREIGTFEDATMDAGCHRLAPEDPATRPPLSTVREAEPDDIDRLARVTAGEREVLEL